MIKRIKLTKNVRKLYKKFEDLSPKEKDELLKKIAIKLNLISE